MSDLKDQVMGALTAVILPELERDLVSLDIVRDLEIQDSTVNLTLAFPSPNFPSKEAVIAHVRDVLIGNVGDIQTVNVQTAFEMPKDPRFDGKVIRSIIAVSSGKGGVGKSTVSMNVAVALAEAGARVGLIDADILNPNLPQMSGLGSGRPKVVNNKMQPIEAYGVKIISTGFLIDPDKPMIMRGPMLQSAIRQFFSDVTWGEIDYMIVDLPPGTGDAPLSLAQMFPLTGAIIVTQPQSVAVSDALRSMAMFEQLDVPIVGVVENMAGDFFGSGGGAKLAQERNVPFLGSVPLEAGVREGGDYGRPVTAVTPESPAGQAFNTVAQNVGASISRLMLDKPSDNISLNITD
jgi:ATP-binding protein involved in chromosome partitioning